MTAPLLSSFESPSTHETVSAIIRRRSSNPQDVRDVALSDLDLSTAHNILDLGCGFGFMAQALAKRSAPDARIMGIDVWSANYEAFSSKVYTAERRPEFVCLNLDAQLPCAQRSFDVAACCYSLYFFADLLPEIARVLTPDGLFIALTHSEDSVDHLLQTLGLDHRDSELAALARRFSSQNGREVLSRCFGEVEALDYPNELCFDHRHIHELLVYVKFKLPLLLPGARLGDELPTDMRSLLENSISDGEVRVEKNDTIFRCRRPLCH